MDDTNRKPICRLHFNSSTKKDIGIFFKKKETRNVIENVDDIFNYSDQIKATILEYLEGETTA